MNKNIVLQKLTDKNNKQAYEYAKKIMVESIKTNKYLEMIPSIFKEYVWVFWIQIIRKFCKNAYSYNKNMIRVTDIE